MLASFRRFASTWVAKAFFAVLVASFGLWGVADVIRNLDADKALAVVGPTRIELPEAQEAYRRQLAQVSKMFGADTQPTPEIRKAVAAQAVERLIATAALNNKVAELGLIVPDDVLREGVFAMPAFQGSDGKFNRAAFVQLLRNNNLSEQRFLEMMRSDLGERQLLEALRAGSAAPDVLTRAVYQFQREQRVASVVELPFAAAHLDAMPSGQQLTRYYENNQSRYSTPEYRRIRAVVLSPQTLSGDAQVSDADITAAYEARKAEFNTAEKRSVQVLLAQDETAAKRLAAAWQQGADWASIQKQADAAGASGVELDDATEAEFPAPELGHAVFAASPGTVPTPVHSALGWHVLKVTKVSPGTSRSLADVTPELRARLTAEKAGDLLYERANKVEDALAAGTTLENLPGDLGLAAVEGTLDAQGNTSDGKPAPIPGPAELRPALIQAAFQAKKGDTANLVQAPNAKDGSQSFYAFEIEDIRPPEVKQFDQVADAVRADWTREAMRHAQEEVAARLLTAVKGGQALPASASARGLMAHALPPTTRDSAANGVAPELINPLFTLKQGEPTMVETPARFIVAVLDRVIDPDPASDPAGAGKIREALGKSIADDTEAVFMLTLRNQANPQVNRAQLESLSQAE
jgi:peptidyl-prolyl cis-trans isomerase D